MLHDDLSRPAAPVDSTGPVETGAEVLRGLVDAGLLTDLGADSYRVHELLRTFTRGAAAGRADGQVLAGMDVA